MSFLLSGTRADAIPDSVIDNFEDDDADPPGVYGTLSDFYGGSLSGFDRNTNDPVFEGDYSLKGTDTGSDRIITSTSGLNRYFSPGESMSFQFQTDNRAQFMFGVPSEAGESSVSGYSAGVSAVVDALRIRRWDEGSAEILADVGQSVSGWTEGQIVWGTDGTIELTVNGTTASATDTTYDSDGVGWYYFIESGQNAVFDLAEVI